MAERPILFSAPMVRAILEGRKTQTRRIVNPQPFPDPNGHGWQWHGGPSLVRAGFGAPYIHCEMGEHFERAMTTCSPYGQPGDSLWVRETWAPNEGTAGGFMYRADHGGASGAHVADLRSGEWTHSASRWRPSIHMPRATSRITLEITHVRVARLADISEADAQAEGCAPECMTPTGDDNGSAIHGPGGFASLWASINGAESWATNPWVWAISFQRVEAPTS